MVRIENLYKSFGKQTVLDGVNLDIPTGESFAIVGPSGVGKSVTIKIISGLLSADAGTIHVGDDKITAESSAKEKQELCSKLGVLFQKAALFDSINLLENVAFPLRVREHKSRDESYQIAYKYLCSVGLSGYEYKLPGEVSIGIRKRVGIARALVCQPEVILFDEPNTGLDPKVGQEIYDLIQEVRQNWEFTSIVISHEIPEVFQVCKKVAMLYNGKFVFMGTSDEFMRTDDPIVVQFREGRTDGPIKIAV